MNTAKAFGACVKRGLVICIQMIVAVIVLAPQTALAEEPCNPKKFQDWEFVCDKIVTLTYEDTLFNEPTKIALSYDGTHVKISAIVTKAYDLKFYTRTLPAFMLLRGIEYVPNRSFANDGFPAIIQIGERETTFGYEGSPHWATSAKDSDQLVAQMKKSDVAWIGYTHMMRGKGQRAMVSLSGFTAALNALQGRAEVPAPTATATDPIQIVGGVIKANNFRITVSDLRAIPNPRGKGAFVYVPNTQFFDTERLFVWFVNGSYATKLNGATNNLTPSLPFPQYADYEIWRNSGVKSEEATRLGLDVVFGQSAQPNVNGYRQPATSAYQTPVKPKTRKPIIGGSSGRSLEDILGQ